MLCSPELTNKRGELTCGKCVSRGGECPRGAGRAKTKQEKGVGGVLKMRQSIPDLLGTR